MKPFLLGIPFENGIRMMQRLGRGVTGAADAPEALLEKLEGMSIDKKLLDLASCQIQVTAENCNDPLAIERDNGLTLRAQDIITQEMETICRRNFLPISIGGDHSITYPLVRGLCRAFQEKRFGLIYLDAHFDLRPLESHAGVSGLISSGNAFRRIIEDEQIQIDGHHMAVIGVHNSDSTLFRVMKQFAKEKGMTVVEDRECTPDALSAIIREAIRTAGNETDGIYLSLDIDAVNAGDAPGVSAPAETGISKKCWLKIIQGIAEKADLAGIDLVEASSRKKHWQELFTDTEIQTFNPQAFNRTLELMKKTLDLFLDVRDKKFQYKGKNIRNSVTSK